MSTRRMFLVILAASAMVLAVGAGAAPGVSHGARPLLAVQEPDPPGATIPYSGRLRDEAGRPVADGAYDFAFALYPTEAGGEALWSEVQEGVIVRDGAFSISLGRRDPLSLDPWTEGSLWLSVAVRGPQESTYTALAPRQQIATASSVTAAPLADQACPHDHFGEQWYSSGDVGLWVRSIDDVGLLGWSDSYIGMIGISTPFSFVWPSEREFGVYGYSYNDHGVYGRTYGDWSWHSGVFGEAAKDNANGVTGWNTGAGPGVYALSKAGTGLYATTEGGRGVYAARIYSEEGDGLHVQAGGQNGFAGYFEGNVSVTGLLSKQAGGFKIDHPLDPEDKYLYHSFVESPDMKNLYDGVVVLDAEGSAWIDLPAWFEALNQDYRYQLTPIGAPGPNLYIAREIEDNRFQIAGGEAGMKVSWQVTGTRHDPFAEANRIPVEEDKPPGEQESYLHPEAYGLPETLGVEAQREAQR